MRAATFTDSRTIPNLVTFVGTEMNKLAPGSGDALSAKFANIQQPEASASPPAGHSPGRVVAKVEDLPQTVARQDPEEEERDAPPAPRKVVNVNGEVLVLTPASFPGAVADGPIFIKFFAPWSAHKFDTVDRITDEQPGAATARNWRLVRGLLLLTHCVHAT